MQRTFWLSLALPLLLAAAPASNGFLDQPMMTNVTIDPALRETKNDGSAGAYTPAPIPDINHDAPVGRSTDSSAARLAPKLFHKQTTYRGEGYVFGSTVQDEQDRRIGPAPGVNLIMPLQ